MKELNLEASVEQLDTVNSFVENELDSVACPPRAAMQIMVAVEEIFVNIAHYAYTGHNGPVTIQIDSHPGNILLRFTDDGIAYDPLTNPDPDTTLSADDRDIGGLGIYMVKKTMDVFTYERHNEQNIVTLVKKW